MSGENTSRPSMQIVTFRRPPASTPPLMWKVPVMQAGAIEAHVERAESTDRSRQLLRLLTWRDEKSVPRL